MIPKERQNAILETLNNKGYISVEELSKKLYVSLATIRRDLNELEKMVFLKELMVVLLLLVKTTWLLLLTIELIGTVKKKSK